MDRARSPHSSRRPAAGFTLVELIALLGVVTVLMALLLPALAAAWESASRVRCASNLQHVGQAVYLFAQDHHGRVPEGQNSPKSGAGSQWPLWMYTKDYFALVDDYGLDQRQFICPSSPLAGVGPSGFLYGEGSELAARASLDELPTDPRPVAAGDEDLTVYWVQTDYQWMGRNVQETLAPANQSRFGAPFEVGLLVRDTSTGTEIDHNPPLMADAASYQPAGDVAHFTHGRHWTIPKLDPTLSLSPWSRGAASAHVGDVRINELFRDGHVELKSPDATSYWSSGGTYFFR